MKKGENIKDILRDIQKSVKPPKGPLSAIDPKKLARVSEDLKIAREIQSETEAQTPSSSDSKEKAPKKNTEKK